MPRSSSGVFHAVVSPWVPVNTPPSGGPTSWPKMSVTPSRVSPTWSAMRMVWIIVAMSAVASDQVAVGEHVFPDRARLGARLVADLAARLDQRGVVGVTQPLDLGARHHLALLERALEPLETVDLVLREVGAARRRVAAQPRHHEI